MNDYIKVLGVLVFLASASAVYIVFEDAGVKMRIDNDVSKFYVQDGRWLISGEERNKLYSGSKLVYKDARNVERNEVYDGLKGTITRRTPYKNGAMILDTYEFDGALEAVEDFPVAHTIEIFDAKGLIYMYEVKRLVYTGASVWDVTSPQSFGRNMKVEFDDGYYYSSIYKYKNKDEGRLWVKYRITEDYVKLDMRLFDPIISENWCYQETATTSTSCGGLDSGNYSFEIDYMYINYSKPVYALSDSVWRVKHGALSAYNISIPTDCWDYDSSFLIFKFDSDFEFNVRGNSTPFCYNGSWKQIGTNSYSACGDAHYGGAGQDQAKTYDGDWDTAAGEIGVVMDWRDTLTSCGTYAYIYEDAMWWHMQDLKLYLNGTSSDRYYEYGSYANLTVDTNTAENVWLDIDAPGYGVNYTNSSTGYLEYDFLTFSGLDKFNDTDSAQNHTANGSFYFTLNKYDVLDYAYVNLTGYSMIELGGGNAVDPPYGTPTSSGSIIDYNNNISISGTVTKYEVACNVPGEFKLKIFRANGTHYVFIGDDTETLSVGIHNYTSSIDVQKGDLIGCFMPDTSMKVERYSSGTIKYVSLQDVNTSAYGDWSTNNGFALAVRVYVDEHIYPADLKLDVGDDGTDDIVLTGSLNDITVWLDEVDNTTAKNLTYTQAGGQIVYLDIYQSSTVDYTKMNFTGHEHYGDTDLEDGYSCSGTFHGSHQCILAVDEDWSTYADAFDASTCYIYTSYTTLGGADINLTAKVRCWNDVGITDSDRFNISCWNFTSTAWSEIANKKTMGCGTGSPSVLNYTHELDSSCESDGDVRFKYYLYSKEGGSEQLYEDKVTAKSYPQNISFDTGNDLHIDYTGTTALTTETQIDLNTTAIQDWIDDECSTVPCAVPISIYTQTSGIIELTDVDVRSTIDNPLALDIDPMNTFLDKPMVFRNYSTITDVLMNATESFSHITEFQYGGTNIISGEFTGEFWGFTWNGSGWSANNSLVAGLPDAGFYSSPHVFYLDNYYWLMLGNYDDTPGYRFKTYRWSGSNWAANTSIDDGLNFSCNAQYTSVETYNLSGDFCLFRVCRDNVPYVNTYIWNGSGWDTSATWDAGLYQEATYSTPEIFEVDSVTYMLTSRTDGAVQKRALYILSGQTWTEDTTLYDIEQPTLAGYVRHSVIDISGTKYLLDGNYDQHPTNYRPNGYIIDESDYQVPVSFTADTLGTLGLAGQNISYFGSKAINVTAHNDDSSYTDSHLINVRYDNYTSDYPYQSDYLTFWLPHGNAKNIEPVGQTYFQNGTDIESTTSWDWNWNLSISLNQSLDSCLALTVKNSTDDSDAGQVINTTARTLWEINKMDMFGLDWYLDATDCNRSVLGIYKFYPKFESNCAECVPIW